MSTSGKMIAGSLPPLSKQLAIGAQYPTKVTHNSNVTLFSVELALRKTALPVAVEPVKLILPMPG